MAPGVLDPASPPPEDLRVVPVRHPGRWVAVVVIAVLVAMLAHSLITNPGGNGTSSRVT
jgi:polar amino acid transport system permease protein